MSQQQKVIFYYLSAFGETGGIQKFNRSFSKALNELAEERSLPVAIRSVYDRSADPGYVAKERFGTFGKNKIASVFSIVSSVKNDDVLVLGHVNLSIAGVLAKVLKPRCRIVLIVHGVEAWKKPTAIQSACIKKADIILSVSEYTRDQLLAHNNIDHQKVRLFPNSIDPFFKIPLSPSKPVYLLERYHLQGSQPIIFTLARLKTSEIRKGYDKVLKSMRTVVDQYPDAVYILAGKTDTSEERRLMQLAKKYDLSKNIILPGFIEETELEDHYQLADVFIMPSTKEGFGIVYIESLACGTPVIGGNTDGTVEALQNGQWGQLVDPSDEKKISQAILNQLSDNLSKGKPVLQEQIKNKYGFAGFKNRLGSLLGEFITVQN